MIVYSYIYKEEQAIKSHNHFKIIAGVYIRYYILYSYYFFAQILQDYHKAKHISS